jgi:Methyltransferase domain
LQTRTDELHAQSGAGRNQIADDVASIRHEIGDFSARSTAIDTQLSTSIRELANSVSGHANTQAWLLNRVETIRAEMLYELRFGAKPAQSMERPVPKVVNRSLVDEMVGSNALRINLGCGHLPLADYANIDSRDLPGVDVVADIAELPFDAGSVQEIFSSHVLEHFAHEELRRRLLPYWVSLLRPGGEFRCVVPPGRQ